MSGATFHGQDPSVEWSELLHGLTDAQRHAVEDSLRHSAVSGWPASRDAVSSLVAYAMGRISSREYAVQIMVSLGFAEAHTAAAMLAKRSQHTVDTPSPSSHFDAGLGADFLTS